MKLPKNYIESLKDIKSLDLESLIKSYVEQPKIGVRFNLKKLTQKNNRDWPRFMSDNGILGEFNQIPWCDTGFYYFGQNQIGKNFLHEAGVYYIQEPSAMAPVNFLDVQPDDIVLDLCASPGGKSTQIAEKLHDGLLISNEIVPSRAKVLAENIQRLGFDNVVVTNHSPKELESRFANFFDKILIDAPCSGEGMFRKNPDAIGEWSEESPFRCADRQKQIVDSAIKMLKPGGKLVYSTCTFSVQENEEVVNYILNKYVDFEILPIDHSKYNFCEGETIEGHKNLKCCARLYPYKIDGEGHFFAVLRKKQNEITTTFKNEKIKNICNKSDVAVFQKWARENLNINFDNFVSVGESLYANCKVCLDRLKILLAGVYLGEIKKGIFYPSYHLAHCLNMQDFKHVQNLSETDAKKYLEGYELDTNFAGWVLVAYQNLPLAFGKGVNGKLKNHYPKNLRKKF